MQIAGHNQHFGRVTWKSICQIKVRRIREFRPQLRALSFAAKTVPQAQLRHNLAKKWEKYTHSDAGENDVACSKIKTKSGTHTIPSVAAPLRSYVCVYFLTMAGQNKRQCIANTERAAGVHCEKNEPACRP